MTLPLNVALVGYGFAGKTFHAPLIDACADLNLHTIVSSRASDVLADWPCVAVVTDLAAALADPAIDLVVIATPDALHAEQATRALDADKAVVVDKPFALTLDDARRVVSLAEHKGLFLSVFQNRRWDADFLALRAEIASGRLGRIVTCESRFDRYRPTVRDRWREGPGAGVWQDLGPHLIDQALVLFGRPLGVTCLLAIQRDAGLSPDWAHCVLRYEDTQVVLNAAMLIAAPDVRFAVHGTRGSWLASGLDPQEDQLKGGMDPHDPGWGVDPSPPVFVDGASGERSLAPGPAGDYPAYYAAVAKAMRDGGPGPVPPREALQVMEILQAGIDSARERREILIPAA
ncbi:oxidoreductase [soil metagenome]